MQNVLGKKKKTHAPHTYNIRNRGVGGSSLGTQRYSTKHKKHPFDNWKILQLSCLNLKKPSSITCWLKTKHINCTCLIESISSVWYSDSNYTKYYAVVLNYKALLPSAGVYPWHFFELGKLVENILWKLLYRHHSGAGMLYVITNLFYLHHPHSDQKRLKKVKQTIHK